MQKGRQVPQKEITQTRPAGRNQQKEKVTMSSTEFPHNKKQAAAQVAKLKAANKRNNATPKPKVKPKAKK